MSWAFLSIVIVALSARSLGNSCLLCAWLERGYLFTVGVDCRCAATPVAGRTWCHTPSSIDSRQI
jgi:hypothetical protein